MIDLNELSDEALRLALIRALERNVHLEGLISSIGERVKSLDDLTLELTEDEYINLSFVYDTVPHYRDEYSHVAEDRIENGSDSVALYPHECPFFSEMFLYDLFGKEEARTILALFNQIQRLAEEDEDTLKRRREEKERLLRAAGDVAALADRIERNRKYLDPGDKFHISRKPRETIRDELDSDRSSIEWRAGELASSIKWYFEDN